MASRRIVAKRGSARRRNAKTVTTLSVKAEAEVAELLERNQAGTISRARLKTGLKEVDGRLKRMIAFIRHLM
jgi:hypothetical protein